MEFTEIKGFEEIIELADSFIAKGNADYVLNYSLKVKFNIDLVKNVQLHDVSELAEKYQAYECPKELYINHGSYISEKGVDHVINELSTKHNSNRAVISLINQCDILDSGDEPRPSFMILQFTIKDQSLYVTTYFRALEVTKFLRINLEEIRLIVNRIYGKIRTINWVKLNVFAFRAYKNKNINPLIKPEIECLEGIDIFIILQKDPIRLSELLKQMNVYSTAINNKSIKEINRIIADEKKLSYIDEVFKSEFIKNLFKNCETISGKLIELRKDASHDVDIDTLTKEYDDRIKEIIEEIIRYKKG